MLLITLLLLVNFLTALIMRLIHGGRLVVDDVFPEIPDKRVYLIAGMLNQPAPAFTFLKLKHLHRVFLNFSPYGYNPRKAGAQLSKLLRVQDEVIGISVGAKAVVYSGLDDRNRFILINPCVYPETLKSNFRVLLKILTPLAEILSFLLGWFAFFEFIPAGPSCEYSIALLVDQLFWSSYGEPRHGNIENIKLVLSTKDEFLDNYKILEAFNGAEKVLVDTYHGRTADFTAAKEYDDAVDFLLEDPTVDFLG